MLLIIWKGAQSEWILFNDEKVVKADAESVKDQKRLANLYFFETVLSKNRVNMADVESICVIVVISQSCLLIIYLAE